MIKATSVEAINYEKNAVGQLSTWIDKQMMEENNKSQNKLLAESSKDFSKTLGAGEFSTSTLDPL